MLNYEVYRNEKSHHWLIFIHGAGGSARTWAPQVDYFSKDFNLLLVDLRDHGESKSIDPGFDKYDFSIISNDIKGVLDHLGIERGDFITLSFGSVLMQDFSARFPDMVNRIVFAGAIFQGNLKIRLFVHLARLMYLACSYQTMYRLFSYLLMPKKRNQKARRVYQLQAHKLTQSEYMKWVGLYREFFQLLNQFYRSMLTNDTLIIMGSEDYVFYQAARKFHRNQPRSQFVTLKGAGHICNLEAPEDFNQNVLAFLKQKEAYRENKGPEKRSVPVHNHQFSRTF